MDFEASRRLVFAAVASILLLAPGLGAQERPCQAVVAPADKQVAAIRAVLTSTDDDDVAYAQALGVAGLTAADIVIETDPVRCTAVTNAIMKRIGAATPTTNLLVLRAGCRFLALNPTKASPWVVESVSATFDDVRFSGM
jgi:hypothetical protein